MEIKEQIRPNDRLSVKAGKTLEDQIQLPKYHLKGILRGPGGEVKDVQEAWNQVQTAGKTHIADQMSDQGEAAMSHMAIGTGTGQGVGDNTLATENDRQALDGATPSHAANVITYHRTFAAGEGTGTMVEAGVFNHAAAGDMLIYSDGISFGKGAGDSLELTWNFTIN